MRAAGEHVQVEPPHQLGRAVGDPTGALPELLQRRVDAHAELDGVPVEMHGQVQLGAQDAGEGVALLHVNSPFQAVNQHDLPVGAERSGFEYAHGSLLAGSPPAFRCNACFILPPGKCVLAT